MKIARFWANARSEVRPPGVPVFSISAWGWSSQAYDEARQAAERNAARAASWLESHWSERTRERGSYYPDRVPREEILREFVDENGELCAFVTRSAMGYEVLCARDLMFIDVDVPPESLFQRWNRRLGEWLGRPVAEPFVSTHRRIAQAAAARSESFRLYRTAAGFRCVMVSRAADATSPQSRALLEEFGADPLYVRLSVAQECFRARLTPKPWRLDPRSLPDRSSPYRFPFADAAQERQQRDWEQRLAACSADFATCRFVEHFGRATVAPQLQELLDLHDEATKAHSELPLA